MRLVVLIASLYRINTVVSFSTVNNIRRNFGSFSRLKMSTLSGAVPDVSQDSINRILKQTTSWCGVHGLMYTDGNVTWTPAPLSLIPNVFSEDSFVYAREIQPIINKLVDLISRDRTFLLEQLSSVSESDEYESADEQPQQLHGLSRFHRQKQTF